MDDLDKYLQVYHDSFSEFLKELGSDPDKVFSMSVLKEHWQKYSKFGLILANVLLIFMSLDEGESFSIAEDEFAKVFVTPIKNQELCNQRSIDVITHFAEKNII